MKKLFILLLAVMTFAKSFSQSLPNYDEIRLDKKEDFNATANDAALQAATYLLSTPMDANSIDRLKSLQYILKWMSGTPDYSFTLDEQATKFAKGNDDLLGLYLAAMTKYVLENKQAAEDKDKIKLNAVKLIIAYAKDTKNNVKINKELKKVIEADEKGKLEEYLND
ncbi:MAG: hypothetical protein JNM88_08140 [Chitinophagaceae bacterium]|nr:hypothetical protein [Chitinophagaceae bacterium]